MTRVSIKDVAARAGVSFQTAGKVLNGKGAVSLATRERILRAAADLGYVPNAVARGMVTRSTCTLGLMASTGGDTVLSMSVALVERAARRRGNSLIVGGIAPDGADGPEVARSLLERRVDGILVLAPQLEDDPVTGAIVAQAPAVSTNPMVGPVSTVQADFHQAAVLATDHLLSLGHRRIGAISGPLARSVARSRLDGYRETLERSGIAFDRDDVEVADWEVEGGYQATGRLLDRAPDLTAIYAQNDLMAVGVLSALHDRGLRVPDDCAVVGCDDLPFAARTIPPLSTVRFPLAETADRAVDVLLEIIRDRASEPRHELHAVSPVWRASSGWTGFGEPNGG